MSTKYAALPASWSNKDEVERLRVDAFESLTRMLNRAVAETGVNFQIWDGLRTHAEQIALFTANYRNTGRNYKASSSDRWYGGTTWARRPGSVAVASPDLGSNHQTGVAIDIHPSAIQEWIKGNGGRFGWDWAEGKRNGEDWHFRYYSSRDQYKAEGLLDHAAVQRVVGADVDGKIGTGTVGKIKAWQKKNGLTADGKVGPATKSAMGLSGKGEPVAPVPDLPSTVPGVAAPLVIEVPGDSPNANQERFGQAIETVTFHWWGVPAGQTHDGTVAYLLKDRGKNGTSAHYVVSPGRVSRCVPEEWTAWANGKRNVNRGDVSVECDPNDPVGTLPTAAALLADIWTRYPDAEVHVHSDWVPTVCNGEYEDLMAELVAMAKGQTVDLPVTTIPAAQAALPTGKALLMALIAAPDYPLLRTPGHLCYYGPRTGPKESVSGHVDNSLNPGEIHDGASGLKDWQTQMVERGYALAVDGKYGPQTANAAENLQRLAGITRDSLVGPDCWYAAWLLPVVA